MHQAHINYNEKWKATLWKQWIYQATHECNWLQDNSPTVTEQTQLKNKEADEINQGEEACAENESFKIWNCDRMHNTQYYPN